MASIELTAEAASELRSLMEGYFSELRMEIERTESGAFRAVLQKREQLVRKLMDQLKP
jgi:hypothetical protein